MTLPIFIIVEGHGECHAVPVLIRRLAHECFQHYDIAVLPPMRMPRGKILADEQLQRAVELGRRRVKEYGPDGGIIVLFDADDECPRDLAMRLQANIEEVVSDVRVGVVMAKREYEAWFLAAAPSLRSHRSVSDQAEAPPEPESIRGAKEYLVRNLLVAGATYSETVDQASYTALMEFEQASRCRSFRKLCDEIRKMLATADAIERE